MPSAKVIPKCVISLKYRQEKENELPSYIDNNNNKLKLIMSSYL